jgi:hypothetical protein
MSERPDITAELAAGETLLWQGHPKPGRPISPRANIIGALLYAATAALMLFAWWLAIYWGHLPAVRLAVYGVIGTAAFSTFVGLRLTLLDRRRARARDRRTAYGITDRRVLVLAGPYRSEVALAPGVRAEVKAGGINIEAPETKLRLDRLSDAKAAREIIMGQIGGRP